MGKVKNEQGVQFKRNAAGKRSTSASGRAVIEAAARAVDAELADNISAESKWHKNYPTYIEALTVLELDSAESSHKIAQAGLAAAQQQFEFVGKDGAQSIAAAIAQPNAIFHTGCIRGTAQPQPLSVPYDGRQITGAELSAQLVKWEKNAITEADHNAAIERVQNNPSWLAGSGHTFVLLGAGSEMGPYEQLLAWGATVVAIDIASSSVWAKLIETARNSAGTLFFPLSAPQTDGDSDEQLAARAGADLLTQAPAIAGWLNTLQQPLTIGCYAYLDGGDHVRLVMAMDAIAQHVTTNHPNTQLAFLLTPTDVYGVPNAVREHAEHQFSKRKLSHKLLSALSGKRLFKPSMRQTVKASNGQTYGIVNSLLAEQGANYMLAKRLQRWRTIAAANAGQLVSCNVAPATLTRSVVKRKLFAAAYKGAEAFGVEVFEPATTKALMAALLINDVHVGLGSRSGGDSAEIFMQNANHGGLWRNAHQVTSALPIAVIIGATTRRRRRK